MEEKKSIKISLATILLIIAIVIILFMAYYIYVEKTNVNKMQKNIDNLQEKIDTISSTINSNISTSISTNNAQINNNINKEETKFSNNEIKKALQNYLDLIGAKAGSPEGMLVKLGLCSYSDYINVNRTEDNYVKTNIKYSTYKEKMLQYVTEECFNSKFKDGYKEQDGILYFSDVGATGMSFEIKDIALKSETSSQEYTAQIYDVAIDGTKELNNIEFSIANNNGNCVISYCNY